MRFTFAMAFLLFVALPWAFRNDVCAAPKPAAPNEVQQEEAAAVVRNLFKAEFAAAKTPADKLTLAGKLVQVAGDTKNDPVGRFVLYRQVRDLAADGGDCELMLEAIGELGADFEVDVLKQKSEALLKFATATKNTTERKAAVRCFEALVAEALAGDRYDLAKSNAAGALAGARKASDLELVKSMSRKVSEVSEAEAEYAKLKDTLTMLEAKPADPAANLQVGVWGRPGEVQFKKIELLLPTGEQAKELLESK